MRPLIQQNVDIAWSEAEQLVELRNMFFHYLKRLFILVPSLQPGL